MIWHSANANDVLTELDTDEVYGLTDEEVAQRKLEQKQVAVLEKKRFSFNKKFIRYINNPLTIALLVVAVIAVVIGIITQDKTSWLNGLAVIICIAACSGVFVGEDYLFSGQVRSLNSMHFHIARVLRNSKKTKIPSNELVLGDILIVKKGDLIPSDARIISCTGLKCNEFALSGETTDVIKSADTVADDIAPIELRSNMLFAGCSVTAGKGIAVVTELGNDTELGKINAITDKTSDQNTPLQNKIIELTRSLSIVIFVVCVFIFIVGFILNLWSTSNFLKITKDNLLISLSLAIATIPSSLTTVVTTAALLGIKRMIKRNISVSSANAAETLSQISLICADKTGTITQNNMDIAKVFDGNSIIDLQANKEISPTVSSLLKMAAACCDVSINYGSYSGDETEIALMNACKNYTGVSKDDLDYLYTRMGEIPFDSGRKMMTTINMVDGSALAIVKGAPDAVIAKCSSGAYENAIEANNAMCDEGLRVLAVAMKPLSLLEDTSNPTSETTECNLRFVGLIGLSDPPRTGVVTAVAKCRNAGIKTVMFTGDQFRTAVAVARKAGILTDGSQAIEGGAVEKMDDEQLKSILPELNVFARLTPESKARVISLYKSLGYKVGVTCDDEIDIASITCADVGFGLAASGTDVALDACNVQIHDDSFETIVASVEEGRGIYKNIRKMCTYLLSCSFALIFTILFGTIIFGISPLAPQQIMLIPLFCVMPSIAMSTEKATKYVMFQKPRKDYDNFFAGNMGILSVIQGLLFSVVAIIAYTLGIGAENANGSNAVAYTMAFAVLVFSIIVNAIILKEHLILNNIKASINKYHVIACVSASIIAILIMTTPIRYIFCFEILTASQWWSVILLVIISALICEIFKIYKSISKKRK